MTIQKEMVETKADFDIFSKIEKYIKTKEQIILLLLVLSVFVYIPFKVLSIGWTPDDDANRHIAFSLLDAKWSDILVIDEKFDTDHNAGWHQVLRFLHKKCGLEKEDLMIFSIVSLFLLLNFCGILVSPSPICWCLAFLFLINIEISSGYRMLVGRPYILSCAVTLIILRLWGVKYYKEKDFPILENQYVKYIISIIAFSLGVWIHGSWYIFLLIPISFFIAGKTSDSIKLTACILVSTIIGALLTGNFVNFLYYHFVVTYTIYSEPTYNWLLVSENATGDQSVYWTIFVTLMIYLCNRKCGYKLKQLADDPIFIMILLCWMAGVFIIRFWIDWGRMALLLWFAYRIGELIERSASLKIPRIRYSLCLYILVCLTICFTNDAAGRYTKLAFYEPIDFYNEKNIIDLKDWAPGEGGVVYSNTMRAFYQLFYKYPNAKWKYILGFESAIMKKEDKEILRNIEAFRVEGVYTPWVNKMTEKDRLILESQLTIFPQLEWIKANKNWWIGRLKKKTENKEIE